MSIQESIETKIVAALQPLHLQVENESHMHNVPPGSESHFRLRVVSDLFRGQQRLARHRRIHKLLAEEIAGTIHALALETLTPEEWEATGRPKTVSPPCLGGDSQQGRGSVDTT